MPASSTPPNSGTRPGCASRPSTPTTSTDPRGTPCSLPGSHTPASTDCNCRTPGRWWTSPPTPALSSSQAHSTTRSPSAPTRGRRCRRVDGVDGGAVQGTPALRARDLAASRLEFPFGPGYDVYKGRGKMSMFFGERDGRPVVTLKGPPSDGRALRDAHREITPGYHMNKRHWITLHPGGTLTVGMVEELVTESYRLVVAGLPRDQQPVEPHAFVRRQR